MNNTTQNNQTVSNNSANPALNKTDAAVQFTGAGSQEAVALATAFNNLFKYFQEQMKQKGMQIENISSAAQKQADETRKAGHYQKLGYLTQGLLTIGMGGFTALMSLPEGWALAENQTKLGDLKTRAPGLLNDEIPNGFANNPARIDPLGAGDPRAELPNGEFGRILRDPTDPTLNLPGLQSQYRLSDEQLTEMQGAARQFQNGSAPYQKELQKTASGIAQDWTIKREIGQNLLRGAAEVGQGSFSALAEKARANAGLDGASVTAGEGALGVIDGAVSRWMNLVELLLQTQTAAANVNRG